MSNIKNEIKTQLTKIDSYIPKKSIIFSKPITKKVKGKKNIEYTFINIHTKNEDGSKGELILPTSRLFSFGVSENVFNGVPNGYTFPICLWNKDGPTEEEIKWTDMFDKIVKCCIDHIIDSDYFSEDLSKKELSRDKGGLSPLYWKMENKMTKNGKKKLQKVDGLGPTLYSKLMYNNNEKRLILNFTK